MSPTRSSAATSTATAWTTARSTSSPHRTTRALRQFGVFGNNNIGIWDHSGESTYHSLQIAVRVAIRARLAIPGLVHLVAFARELRDDRQRPARREYHATGQPEHRSGLGATGNRADAHLQLVDDLDAADARRPTARSMRAFLETGRSPDPRRRHRPAAQRLHRQSAAASTAARREPATPTTNAPNRVSGEPCRASSGPDEQIINPAPTPSKGFRLGTIGNAGRGDCTGPGYFQTDLAFYKNFPLKNGVKMQFRWDIFNIFNNTNFLFQNLDATMDPVGGGAQRGPDRDRQRHDSRQFRSGHPHAGSAADADRVKAALVSQ